MFGQKTSLSALTKVLSFTIAEFFLLQHVICFFVSLAFGHFDLSIDVKARFLIVELIKMSFLVTEFV